MAGVFKCTVLQRAGQQSHLHPAKVAFDGKSFSHLVDKVAGFFGAQWIEYEMYKNGGQ